MPQLQEEAVVEAFDEEVYRVKFGKVSDTLFVYIDLLFPNSFSSAETATGYHPHGKMRQKLEEGQALLMPKTVDLRQQSLFRFFLTQSTVYTTL